MYLCGIYVKSAPHMNRISADPILKPGNLPYNMKIKCFCCGEWSNRSNSPFLTQELLCGLEIVFSNIFRINFAFHHSNVVKILKLKVAFGHIIRTDST